MTFCQCIWDLFPEFIVLFYWENYLTCIYHYEGIVHILFYNYWVGKSLCTRYICKILCIIEPCIRIKMKARVVGQELKITRWLIRGHMIWVFVNFFFFLGSSEKELYMHNYCYSHFNKLKFFILYSVFFLQLFNIITYVNNIWWYVCNYVRVML